MPFEAIEKEFKAPENGMDKLFAEIDELEKAGQEQQKFFQGLCSFLAAIFVGYYVMTNKSLKKADDLFLEKPEFSASNGQIVEEPTHNENIRYLTIIAKK